MIDPTCGSGHLLLGAFDRLFRRWQAREPGGNARDHVVKALDAVHGVDLNPFAVAIARFRLVLAALRAGEYRKLTDVDGLDEHIHLAVGDSLLGGVRFDRSGRGEGQGFLETEEGPIAPDAYATETPRELDAILGRQYHAVVGNPPYITPKDPAQNQAYRARYPKTCHRQYSLGVPFTERFFDLALASPDDPTGAGHVGMITANSFMKREFGKKLIQEFLPTVDLTHVIDTSGAYIPGHGTPTVILLGRNRKPVTDQVRAVLGIRGEPTTPDDPSEGLVWRSIVDHLDNGRAENEFVSVTHVERVKYGKHPWSIGGGGAVELKDQLVEAGSRRLDQIASSIGFYQDTHADEAFVQPKEFVERRRLWAGFRGQIRGDDVRDWKSSSNESILFPYDERVQQWIDFPREERWSWFLDLKTLLWERSTFGGGTYRSTGRPWYDYHQFPRDRARSQLSIPFAFVATHNHFVFDRNGSVFNRSAPVIKLPDEATDDDHLALIGLLNSSTACFWMKQNFQTKGSSGIGRGVYDERWEFFYEHTVAGVGAFPVVEARTESTTLARDLESLGRSLVALSPPEVVKRETPTSDRLAANRAETERIQTRMVALQEELDWLCYRLYGLLDADDPAVGDSDNWAQVPGLELGQRPFEIVMARQMAAGELQTSWFARHSSTPITEIPADRPDWYRDLVARRIELIESNPNIGLIERPECKRRWQREPWDDQVRRALRSWLLDRLETPDYWPDPEHPELMTVAQLADRAGSDRDFLQVAALYRGTEAVDVLKLLAELVASESVPFLPVLRYTETGLRTRAEWRETWRLQRDEDEGKPLLDRQGRPIEAIPVPPKYARTDFQKPEYWGLRGKLDVPKERFVSYPGCERPGDPTLPVAWAGWDHLQQARAIATYFVRLKDEGVPAERLVALLAGIDELIFWLKLWHNTMDPAMGMGLGDYFEDFVATEALAIGYTGDQVRAWRPPAPKPRGRKGS